MGLCASGLTAEEAQQQKVNARIDKEMKQALIKDCAIIKLLLLGAGESGKSTIFKQMKLLYGAEKKFSDEDQLRYRSVIHSNTISAMQTLIQQAANYPDPNDANVAIADQKTASSYTDSVSHNSVLDANVAAMIKALWNDPGIQRAYQNRSNFQLPDSAKYFFDKVDELGITAYVPNNQDILRSRVRTSGIVEEHYVIEEVQFVMYDVGGQRNERKKWIHCFENVTAVIFVAALSEYDQVLYEDATTNRMEEAINLFNEICNSQWFKETAMILFLNKEDLFREKIQLVDPKDVLAEDGSQPWVDFPGGIGDYQLGCDYFQSKFMDQNMNKDKQVYAHVTCATNTSNVKVVFETCKMVILTGNLENVGLM